MHSIILELVGGEQSFCERNHFCVFECCSARCCCAQYTKQCKIASIDFVTLTSLKHLNARIKFITVEFWLGNTGRKKSWWNGFRNVVVANWYVIWCIQGNYPRIFRNKPTNQCQRLRIKQMLCREIIPNYVPDEMDFSKMMRMDEIQNRSFAALKRKKCRRPIAILLFRHRIGNWVLFLHFSLFSHLLIPWKCPSYCNVIHNQCIWILRKIEIGLQWKSSPPSGYFINHESNLKKLFWKKDHWVWMNFISNSLLLIHLIMIYVHCAVFQISWNRTMLYMI